MVEIQWVGQWTGHQGKFRRVATTKADSFKDAMDLIFSIFPEAKIKADDDYSILRVTAKSPGGRSGMNVAYIEECFE